MGIPLASGMNWRYKIAQAILHVRPLDKNTKDGCWTPKASVTTCEGIDCNQPFSWNYWKHHCYVCGRVVCGRCTSNSLFKANRNRRCRNIGGHQNREIECLKRRIEFGGLSKFDKYPCLTKLMTALPDPELIHNQDNNTYTWTKDYLPTGRSIQLHPPSGQARPAQPQPASGRRAQRDDEYEMFRQWMDRYNNES